MECIEGGIMIQLTRINHVPLVVNCDLIEHIEATPDTVISMTNGQKLVVLESIDIIVKRVIEFRRAVLTGGAVPDFTDVGLQGPEPVLCATSSRA
jgi:flagellar protein FlbD